MWTKQANIDRAISRKAVEIARNESGLLPKWQPSIFHVIARVVGSLRLTLASFLR